MSYFIDTIPNIEGNKKLRAPQVEAYLKIKEYFEENQNGEGQLDKGSQRYYYYLKNI